MINSEIQDHLCELRELGAAFHSTGNKCAGKTILTAVSRIRTVLTEEHEQRRKAEYDASIQAIKDGNERIIGITNLVAGKELLKRQKT